MYVKWLQDWPDDITQVRQEWVRDEIAARAFIDDLAMNGIRAWTENS